MWFDPYAALAERRQDCGGHSPAIPAISASRSCSEQPHFQGIAGIAGIAALQLPEPEKLAVALDAFTERAAIREFDGEQPRAEAERAALTETAAAYGITTELLARHIKNRD